MLKILASWKKLLSRQPLFRPGSLERLQRALRRRGLYLVLLAILFGGSYYLVTNDAVFKKPTIQTFTLAGQPASQELPVPREPLVGSTTVPPELQEQPGAQAAPATAAGQVGKDEALPSLALPVSGKMGKGYGFTYTPAFDDYRFHSGVDLEAPAGSEVKAAAAGVVKQVEHSDAWRYRLIIDNGNGYQTVYAHLSSIKIAKGDKVQRGTILGQLGDPGTAEAGTPAHLHLELLKNGKAIDPVPALQ
ncbi:Duplicated hybrid motif [Moorella glycerini]|uniref:Murein DD-endopeptidase MepM n=1 Tax=Neomoorella stamsii TaxID=1266720 RepID=A0A9X7P542_9FIRM|nr:MULTISPECIES: M23 family metallopeptidase [Moorella]PRR70004.1 Murein DD-endopeptidase MepM [Moorella stamsii]CEP68445.1 Duplicated hybrid motif [Moorella glycerini]